MATFDRWIWSPTYRLKKKIFIFHQKGSESLQKSTTLKEGIVVGAIVAIVPMVLIPKQEFNFGTVFVLIF
jgi:hypothetical protein